MKVRSLILAIALMSCVSHAQAETSELMDDYYGLDEIALQSWIEQSTPLEQAKKAATNLGAIFVSCPTTHALQLVSAALETIPMLAALPHMLDLGISEYQPGSPGVRAGLLGGPANGAIETLNQTIAIADGESTTEAKTQIAKALSDGYSTAAKLGKLNHTCYRAERRLQMLMRLNTRVK